MVATPDLDELYEASYRRLVVQLFAVCGVMADAEDAVQEAFVTALRKPSDLARVSNPEAWLMGMQPLEVRDGLTGDRLAIRAPDGYPDTDPSWLVQWLADDSVVIFDPLGDQDRLLVCTVPTGTCEIAVTRPSSLVVPDAWWR